MSKNKYDIEIIADPRGEGGEHVILNGQDISKWIERIEYVGKPLVHKVTLHFNALPTTRIRGVAEVTSISDKTASQASVDLSPRGGEEVPVETVIIRGRGKNEQSKS